MTKEKVTKASILPMNPGGPDHRVPPFYSIADQIISKAIVYRDEGNTASVHSTLDRSKIGIAETRSQRYTIPPCFQSANLLQLVTQTSPSPGISCIHTVPHAAKITRITGSDSVNEHSKSSCKESTAYNALKDVHISAQLMEDFLELARDNTSKDLETCGVLGASLKEGTFYVTTLIIPKQESTSNSCQTRNEVEIFAIQNEQSLYPVGWIHTHPSQSCFMSSIDLHTQYSYQVMVPEAVAIVMAPTDKSRGYGVFRLSEPGGMNILRECQEGGYHPHREPAGGSSIYEHCSNVFINPYLRLEICDLR